LVGAIASNKRNLPSDTSALVSFLVADPTVSDFIDLGRPQTCTSAKACCLMADVIGFMHLMIKIPFSSTFYPKYLDLWGRRMLSPLYVVPRNAI
jgi:hypothetical protein